MKAILPGAGWQRCRVHFARNVTQQLGSARSKPVNALIGTCSLKPPPRPSPASYRHIADSLHRRIPTNRSDARPQPSPT